MTDRARRAAFPLALVALVLVTTGGRFANGFVFDDVAVIVDGDVIHDPSRITDVWTRHTMYASDADQGGVQSVDTYRPVPITLFMVDAAIGGRSPIPYHVTNLLLHVLVVLLVYALALRWLGEGARVGAFYGAAVFAAHPWAVEAHVWINGRSDPLCALFGLAAMMLWLSAEERPAPWKRPLGAATFLLGLLSKEVLLLAAPAIALMPAPWSARLPLADRLRGRLPWLAGACAAYLALRAAVLSGLSTHRDGEMLAEAAYHLPWLLADALYRALVPGLPFLRSLRDEYAGVAPWQVGLGAVAVGAAVAIAIRYRRRQPLAVWSLLWFLLPLLPIAILTTVLWPGFGRYLYLPLAGLAWALADVVRTVVKRRRVSARLLRAAALVHIGVCALGAASYTFDHRDDERLYHAAIEARPDVAMGYGWLGLSRLRRGDPRRAVAPLSHAAQLDPQTHRYLLNESRARLLSGDRAGAAAVAARGIERFDGRPEEAGFHLLALNALPTRDPRAALSHLLRCLEVWPDRPDCAAALRAMLHAGPHAAEHHAVLQTVLDAHPEWRAIAGP